MSSARTVKPGEPVTYHATERQKIDITFLGDKAASLARPESLPAARGAASSPIGGSGSSTSPVRVGSDIAGPLISYLDATLALSRALTYVSPPHLMPEAEEWELVRHVCLLWASANGLKRFDIDRDRVIRFSLTDAGHYLFLIHVPDGCDFDPRKPAPAPRVVISDDAMWSPASGQEMP